MYLRNSPNLNEEKNQNPEDKPCSNCKKYKEKIFDLEESLKSAEDGMGNMKLELEHVKIIQEQSKIIFEKKIEDSKQAAIVPKDLLSRITSLENTCNTKDNEISNLRKEILQRDSLLEKARSLVFSLNNDNSKKNREIEELSQNTILKSEYSKLLEENQSLLQNLQALERKLEETKSKIAKKDEHHGKIESFSFETESFGSKVAASTTKEALIQKLESNVMHLETEIRVLTAKNKEIILDNGKLSEAVKSLENRLSQLSQEKAEVAENLIKAYETIEEYKVKQNHLEGELQTSKINANVEDLSKLLLHKENVINELSSQMVKTNKHKRHRHNSYLKEIYELMDAVKKEIKTGKDGFNELSKDAFQVFKDFQYWYRTNQLHDKTVIFEDMMVFFLQFAKGRHKEEISSVISTIPNLEPEMLMKKVKNYIQILFSSKLDVFPKLKILSKNIYLSIESINVVTSKLEEIKKNAPRDSENDFGGRVIDLTLTFLKNFAKEREIDYEISTSLLKIIG
ncbi:hypothetical protein SteCoe_21537 [Stentor coeruleus]|uniref:Uncharacterized protein n=1 Tax=Stentor coeruleus TaxID=5963 RepID=A0A1R2BP87_9CILI|nr:hypothetical protein SteCoe_21537 [Stentor coeruleus]